MLSAVIGTGDCCTYLISSGFISADAVIKDYVFNSGNAATGGAPVQHGCAIRDRQNRLWMLLNNDRAQAFFPRDAADGAQQLLHDDGGQALQRLIQQQQAGVQHQRAAHCQHLLLAA